jgi:hypothetical protein
MIKNRVKNNFQQFKHFNKFYKKLEIDFFIWQSFIT